MPVLMSMLPLGFYPMLIAVTLPCFTAVSLSALSYSKDSPWANMPVLDTRFPVAPLNTKSMSCTTLLPAFVFRLVSNPCALRVSVEVIIPLAGWYIPCRKIRSVPKRLVRLPVPCSDFHRRHWRVTCRLPG